MMAVNLFDATFAHEVCSTAGAVPAHVRYVRDQRAWDGVTLFTDGYLTRPEPDQVACPVKLGWLHEPPGLIPQVYADAVRAVDRFDAVLTYHPDLLARPGFRFMPYGGVWVPRAEWGMRAKTRLCSMLIGAKSATAGHRIRPAIADAVAGLGVDFYGARGEPVPYGAATKLRVLASHAFSIVGETDRLDNLFTEWLLDCFALGTVPAFWGCPNVGDYFDARGVLNFETPEQCAQLVAGLSFDLYESLLPFAAENLRRVAEYAVAEDYMYRHILRAYEQ